MRFKTYDLFGHRAIEDVATEIIYYYLFKGVSLTGIEIELFHTDEYHGWLSKSFLNFHGISTASDDMNKAIYLDQPVCAVVYELSHSDNPTHLRIAKLLNQKYVGESNGESNIAITQTKNQQQLQSEERNDDFKRNQVSVTAINKETMYQKKVGEIAQCELNIVLENCHVSIDEIQKLLILDYSHKVLGLGYPLLVLVNHQLERSEQVVFSGHSRYYKNSVSINGNEYFVTSEWYTKSKPLLISWILKHMK